MLSDIEIKDLAKRMSIPLGGVCFKDQLPNFEFNKAYILNIEDHITDDGVDNEGTHWVFFQVQHTPKGTVCPMYVDSFGFPPPQSIVNYVQKHYKIKNCPYSTKDIQSLVNNACGFYALAVAYYVNVYNQRTGNIYDDVNNFLDLFEDLNKSADFKKNEYILKLFFTIAETAKDITVHPKETDKIINGDEKGGIDMMKIPVDINWKN